VPLMLFDVCILIDIARQQEGIVTLIGPHLEAHARAKFFGKTNCEEILDGR